MEKRGVIEAGRTPPEDREDKQAAEQSLESHPTQRIAAAAQEELQRPGK